MIRKIALAAALSSALLFGLAAPASAQISGGITVSVGSGGSYYDGYYDDPYYADPYDESEYDGYYSNDDRYYDQSDDNADRDDWNSENDENDEDD